MSYDIQVLFHEVADLPPAEREQYFNHRGVPPHIREEVESLLNFDSFNGPHAETLSGFVATAVTEFFDSDTGPGEGGRCGSYELIRLLGRGGMGAVFLAQRTDGEVEQRVAIKVVRNAAAEPAFRDRYLRERQILASLSHPGIARLLDAGHTTGGQPYLVMEYIDGTPIDVHAQDLDLREKLRLFLLVCDAISYVHRNLVIHRDLKPSNILVDSSGQPSCSTLESRGSWTKPIGARPGNGFYPPTMRARNRCGARRAPFQAQRSFHYVTSAIKPTLTKRPHDRRE
jgi:serine/threonine protein kinase